MKYLKRKEINDLAWNNCIEKSNPSFLQAFSWYLDIICKNWDALVVEENGEYIACFPIPWKKKAGFKYVYPPYFAQQLGLFSNSIIDSKPFLLKIQSDFKWVELYLHFVGTPTGEEKTNLILPLSENYAAFSNEFTSNHKRNIQKAEKSNVIIKHSPDFNSIIELFKKNRGKTIKNLKKSDYLTFGDCCNVVAEHQKLKIIHALDQQNKLLAGAVFFIHQNRITFVFSGVSDEGKKTGALFLIINSIVQEFQHSNYILDFEGSENPGIQKFYRGFGAVNQNYYFFKSNRLPFPLNRLKK